LKQHQDVEKVIICVDSECTGPGEIWEEVERELNEMGLPVRYAVVVHALEGWLAADPRALEQVLGIQVCVEQNLEEVCKPAELLEDIFAQHGKSFQKTRHGPQIARYADPVEIARHSSSFRRFCQLVTAQPVILRNGFCDEESRWCENEILRSAQGDNPSTQIAVG